MATIALTTIADGALIVAADLRNDFLTIQNVINGQIDAANLSPTVGAWTAYVPAWTSTGVAPVPNNGTIVGKYMQIGKTVHGRAQLTMGSTTTFGTGAYLLSLPVAANAAYGNNFPIGAASIVDASPSATYVYTPLIVTSTTFTLESAASPGGGIQATFPITFASGDIIMASFTYEAA